MRFLPVSLPVRGYTVESNREHGEGRSDVVVFDARSGRVAILEAKYAQRLEKLTESCHDAFVKWMNESTHRILKTATTRFSVMALPFSKSAVWFKESRSTPSENEAACF